MVGQGADRKLDGWRTSELLDMSGYEGAAETGREQTRMEERCADRVQSSDRGWTRTEQNITLLINDLKLRTHFYCSL